MSSPWKPTQAQLGKFADYASITMRNRVIPIPGLAGPIPIKDTHVDDKPTIGTTGIPGFSEQGSPEEWDLAVGEIYGYRWWKFTIPARLAGYLDAPEEFSLSERHPHLAGANAGIWKTGRNEAVCDAFAGGFLFSPKIIHEPPEIRVDCGCGYWAYFDKNLSIGAHFISLSGRTPRLTDANLAFVRPDTTPVLVDIPVFGVVKGTGRVIIGDKGFRSQYAEIVGLCLPYAAQQQLGWWIKQSYTVIPPAPYTGMTRGPEAQRAFDAMTGRDGKPKLETRMEGCQPFVQSARISTVEAMLSEAYPSARIFTEQDTLTGYFPPDKNYANLPG